MTSFVELATRYWKSIHRVCWILLSDRQAAAEVAEATFLSALHDPGIVSRRVPAARSLYREAVSRSLHRLPALRKAPFDSEGAGGTIRHVLLRLDAIDRAAFVLREVERLPTEEVAAVLGIAPRHVRRRVHRATMTLAGFLGRSFETPRLGRTQVHRLADA